MIVSIILSILKIIGITLLCILGLILLVVLLVLFVPIRYKVSADSKINEQDKEYHIKVKVSWLLWLVRGKYEYPSEDGFVLRVGPFRVYDTMKEEKPKKKPKERKQKLKKKVKTVEDNNASNLAEKSVAEENVSTKETIETLSNPSQDAEKSAEKETDILEEMLEGETEKANHKKANRKTLKEKILYTWQKIYDKINKIRQKIKSILKNIKKYLAILQSEEFEEAFALCKDSIVRLFCMIKPRKVKIKGTAGMKSPEQTGYLCGAVGVISPFFKKQIQITPDFEQFVIEGNAMIKGRIYVIVLLIIAIKVFFDDNIRKVMEMFRKEEA